MTNRVRSVTIQSESSGVASKDQEGEPIVIDQNSEHYSSNRGESMASITGAVTTVLKAVHPDPFNSESLRAKMFIIQMNNKIADAAEAMNEQKIQYAMLLLRDPALKWTATFINNNREITFGSYLLFKQKFLRRFTDLNSVDSIIEKLMNLK